MSGLVYVGKVSELKPIENADRIVSATAVCGAGGKWSGVVQKDAFQIGQPCVVYLQDSIVPQCEELAFLKSTGWRVKMARFRGAPSECVIVPAKEAQASLDTGTDITLQMGVTKYEKTMPTQLCGDALGFFPQFIPKTDEVNFQKAYRLIEDLRGKPWYATVKYDGSSCTAYRRDGNFGVCSRNLELKEGENAYWQVAKKLGLHESLPNNMAVQFEVVGPGIQNNPLGLRETTGFVFNAWDIEERRYLDWDLFMDLCHVGMKLPLCELVAQGESFDLNADQLRSLAEGTYPNGKQREGIVIRPKTELYGADGRVSFKVINLLYKD